uniref:Uncharacterized protein n=1 Tax=Romanomermis culicivorax TaxID=13658 RepID=A0A915KVC1_ROMCU
MKIIIIPRAYFGVRVFAIIQQKTALATERSIAAAMMIMLFVIDARRASIARTGGLVVVVVVAIIVDRVVVVLIIQVVVIFAATISGRPGHFVFLFESTTGVGEPRRNLQKLRFDFEKYTKRCNSTRSIDKREDVEKFMEKCKSAGITLWCKLNITSASAAVNDDGGAIVGAKAILDGDGPAASLRDDDGTRRRRYDAQKWRQGRSGAGGRGVVQRGQIPQFVGH